MPTITPTHRIRNPIQTPSWTPFGRLQKPQERSAAGPTTITHNINTATSVTSDPSMLRLNDHHKLLIIAVPRFSQNVPEITHYEIDQPLRGVPFKCPCGQTANRKCYTIMNDNLCPFISHYQSSLKLLIKSTSRTVSAIIIATPQPAITKPQMKSKTFSIIYLQKRKKWMSAAKAPTVITKLAITRITGMNFATTKNNSKAKIAKRILTRTFIFTTYQKEVHKSERLSPKRKSRVGRAAQRLRL